RRLITVYRSRIGLREHPKYYIVRVLDLAKRAILEEAAGLVGAGLPRSGGEGFLFSPQGIPGLPSTPPGGPPRSLPPRGAGGGAGAGSAGRARARARGRS